MGELSHYMDAVSRLRAELQSIVDHGTHANHKYETCGVCMAERALGEDVDEEYVRNLPRRVTHLKGKST